MSREAVERVLAFGKEAYASGRATPATCKFDGAECCILGAAAVTLGADRSDGLADRFGESQGLSSEEAWSVMTAWDCGTEYSVSEDRWLDREAWDATLRVRAEIAPDLD